jgi:hypothetical protein
MIARKGRHVRPDFILSEYDRQARHQTYRQAFIQLKLTPQLVETIGSVAPETVLEVGNLLRLGYGPPRLNELKRCSPQVKALFEGVKFAGSHLKGSNQSYSRLRSIAGNGATALWGEWTSFITINMSEVHSQVTFRIMGQFNEFDLGSIAAPDGTTAPPAPSMTRLKQALVNDPTAIAEFSQLIIYAFHAVYFGWPVGKASQVTSDCLMDLTAAIADKYENSGRMAGKHDHIMAKQPKQAIHRVQEVSTNNIYRDRSCEFVKDR